jgi:protocatechuate 3,4-dioxygenase beta subunit
MSRRILFPAIVLVVALGLMWLERRGGAQGAGAPAGPAALERAGDDAPQELAAPVPVARRDSPTGASTEAQLEVAPLPRSGAPTTSPDTRATWVVRGIVLDTEGAPVPGLALVVLPEGSSAGQYDTIARALTSAGDGAARSAPDGRFTLDSDTRRCEIFATGPEWATLYAGRAEAWAAEEEVLVVVAAPMQQAGRVVDTSDVPVVGAELWTYDQDGTGLPGFPLPLVRCVRVGPRWTTGADGEFDLAGFTWIPGRRVDVEHAEHVRTHFYPQGEARGDWLVVMDRRPVQPVGELGLRSEPMLFGFVRYADGRPAPGAHVRLMGAEALADDDGRWEFERPGSMSAMVALVAVADGAGPAIRRDATAWSGGGERIGPIELMLTEESLALRGRVVDTRGAPLPGFEARVFDPTLVDESASPYVTLERGLAPDAAWPMTDAEGRFVLHGLSDREYTVLALDTTTSLAVSARARPSAEELVLVVPDDALIEELDGVVLDQRGVPVRGVSVAVELEIERYEVPNQSTVLNRTDPRATTDAEGSFRLARVPRRGITLQFTSESIRSKSVAPGEAGFGPGRLEVRVARSMLVRVDVRGRVPLPTSVRFLDASGGPAIVKLISRGSMFDVPLHDGRSEIVSAPETATVAVLRQNELEIGRIDLALQPGVVNVVAAD